MFTLIIVKQIAMIIFYMCLPTYLVYAHFRLREEQKEEKSRKDNLHDIFQSFYEKQQLRDGWHIPIKINPPPMPDIPMPRMMNIRSDL